MGKIINENKKFPEKLIPIGWKYKKLFEICSIEYGKSPQNIECLDGKFSIFGTGGIIGRTNSFIYDKPSIIIGRKGTLNKPVLIDIPFWTIDTTFYIKIKGQYNIPWLFYYLDYIKLERFNEASGVPSLSRENLYCLKILTPSLSEQKIISNILTTWEKSIRQLEKLISIKKKMKKALMQQLLTGKKRLKGFNDKAEYHALKNYIYEISVRNKNNDINNVLSVTNTKGFINQSEQFDKSVASDDLSNYKIIKKGQFAYNPSRVNVGSIDLLKSFNYGILSPMYIIFETDNKKLQSEFLYYHLKSHWFIGHIPMFVQGSVRNSLSFDGLCGMKFFIPSVEEQKEITSILLCADKEIELLKRKLELLKKQKRGLMQVLLTGKVRVK